MKLSATAQKILTKAANSNLGTVQPNGGAGWESRVREREARKLVELGLLKPYPHDGELEITDAGRNTLASQKAIQ